VVLCERRFTLGHLDSGDAEGPNIRLEAIPGLTDDLGRHPERRANKGVAKGRRQLSGDAEIGELDFARGGEEDIGGLDVAVDLAL
jgi:hypothetical protein